MLARLRSLLARAAPHGWLDIVRQVALFAAAYYLYRLVRGAVDGRAAEAFQNARELISVEQTLQIFVEPSVQAWASGSQLFIDVASWIYINAQISITVGALVFIYLFHNQCFYFVRNMFMVSMGLALVGYALYPTAPPRFMPEWGFFDAVADFTGIPHDSVPVNALFNPYAAIPSMHVAFALMIGWPLAYLSRWLVVRAFWFLYPFLVTFVTVATANHFLVDAVLGAMTAGLAAYAAAWLARVRPHAWAFGRVREGPAEATA
jgi:hypothetical protein